MSKITIGVDIAKKKFDVASLIDGKYKHKTFTNDNLGFIAFIAWFLPLCGDVNPLNMQHGSNWSLQPPAC